MVLSDSAMRVFTRFITAHRVVAWHLLAKTWDELLRMITTDAAAAEKWKQKFVVEAAVAVRKTHGDVLRSGKLTDYGIADANRLLNMAEAALQKIAKDFARNGADELETVLHEIHNEHWDPEMFADGQTKADYGAKPLDPLFDYLAKMTKHYREFWRRLLAKYDIGSLNTTLLALLAESQRQEGKITLKLYEKLYDGGDAAQALLWYRDELVKLRPKAEEHAAKGWPNAFPVGSSLSRLQDLSEKKGDEWTNQFARSLMDQAHRRRPFSPKQKTILEQKLQEYGVPRPNYEVWW